MRKSIITLFLTLLCLFTLSSAAMAFDTAADTQNLLLVNSDFHIDKSYKAADLTKLDSNIWQNGTIYMRKEAASALKLMLDGVVAAGYPRLTARSGYRSYDTQNYMFNTRVSERQASGMSYSQAYSATLLYTAYPGTSEHQTGLAQDVSNIRGALNNDFGNIPAAAWLRENSWHYGFILRYTEEKRQYTKIASEPWHFRYVGMPHAQIIYEHGWSFEEYIGYLQNNGSITFEDSNNIYEIIRTTDTNAEFDNIIGISSDNTGGWIITTCRAKDILSEIGGNWAEQCFIALLEGKEFNYPYVIKPSAPITRADFALLYDLIGEYLYAGSELKEFGGYSDVPSIAYYYDALNRLARAGVMVGSGDKFNPNDYITREATATAIANVIKDDSIKLIDYKDLASIAGWAFQGVQRVTYHGLMIGTDGYFNPKGNLTWAEAAAIILRFRGYLQNQQLQKPPVITPPAEQPTDTTPAPDSSDPIPVEPEPLDPALINPDTTPLWQIGKPIAAYYPNRDIYGIEFWLESNADGYAISSCMGDLDKIEAIRLYFDRIEISLNGANKLLYPEIGAWVDINYIDRQWETSSPEYTLTQGENGESHLIVARFSNKSSNIQNLRFIFGKID